MFRGDLDWITMKALEKDRTRRYQTASGLAADIERYLHDEPVEASPPSASYRLKKLAHRHRAALVTSAAFVSLLIAAVIVSTWFAFREKSARELADQNAALAAQNAERARIEAENAQKARLAAEAQQKLADDQRKVAEIEKQRADKNAKQAEQRRQEADSERRLAEREKSRADAKAVEAEQRRQDADRQKQLAEQAWRRARLATYAKHLATAWREIEGNNLIAAGRELDACDWDLRGWEHHYLWGLLERRLPLNIAPADKHSQFSADGRYLASLALADRSRTTGTVREELSVRNLATNRANLSRISCSRICAIGDSYVYSPDGRHIAVVLEQQQFGPEIQRAQQGMRPFLSQTHVLGCAHVIVVVRVDDGRIVFTAKNWHGRFHYVNWSGNGRKIAALSDDGVVMIWDVTSGSLDRLFRLQDDSVNCLKLDSEGTRLAAGTHDGRVMVVDAQTGKVAALGSGHSDRVSTVIWTADDRLIASAGEEKAIKLWDSKTSRVERP
jgi:hypothetical protein